MSSTVAILRMVHADDHDTQASTSESALPEASVGTVAKVSITASYLTFTWNDGRPPVRLLLDGMQCSLMANGSIRIMAVNDATRRPGTVFVASFDLLPVLRRAGFAGGTPLRQQNGAEAQHAKKARR